MSKCEKKHVPIRLLFSLRLIIADKRKKRKPVMEEPVSTDSGSVFRKDYFIYRIIKLFNYFIVARKLRNSFTERWYRHFYCLYLTMRQQARVFSDSLFYEQIILTLIFVMSR